MPKQLVALAPRKASLIDYEDKPVSRNEIKVKLEFASPKHGTELAAFRGTSPYFDDYYDEDLQLFMPRDGSQHQIVVFGEWNLGNQWVGRIIDIGSDVAAFKLGERVCGYGGIRETHNIDAVNNNALFKLPEDMSWQNAVCYDPAAFALGGVRDGHVRLGDRVAVFGLGAIGQLAVQMCKLAGASYVAAVDPISLRRKVALDNGADQAFDPTTEDVGLELKRTTRRGGMDVIIETSASEHAISHVMRGLAYGGTIAYVGAAGKFRGNSFDLGREAHHNNGKLIFSRACSEPNPDHPRWSYRRIQEEGWEMLKSGRLNCTNIIYPVVSFADSAVAYEKYVDKEPDSGLKLGVSFL